MVARLTASGIVSTVLSFHGLRRQPWVESDQDDRHRPFAVGAAHGGSRIGSGRWSWPEPGGAGVAGDSLDRH